MANTIAAQALIQSTAGAIPVKNEKGELSMQKVKVHRYISGKRPEYASFNVSDDESDDDFGFEQRKSNRFRNEAVSTDLVDRDDSRLKRLQRRDQEEDIEDRMQRHRHIHEPEVLAVNEEEILPEVEMDTSHRVKFRDEMEESSDEEELDEEEIERRRMLLRLKAKERKDEEVLEMEEEAKSAAEESEEESSEYEEYTDSEEENGPRLKPVFVKKRDRITVQERERQLVKQKEVEVEAKRAQEDRRKASLKRNINRKRNNVEIYLEGLIKLKHLVNTSRVFVGHGSRGGETCCKCSRSGHLATICPEVSECDRCYKCNESGQIAKDCNNEPASKVVNHVSPNNFILSLSLYFSQILALSPFFQIIVEVEARKELMEENNVTQSHEVVITDDENDEVEYEAWKLRELKRIKRDKEEREMWEKEKMELDRIHHMTEEERRALQRSNPKLITNKAAKGKYKFLQKYYHRGAFFMNDEVNVFKRDFAEPTLEDHFDKTILPKVMQVKNFGRSGRTKYTHLVDHDTTNFDSPWTSDMAQKFHFNKGGGMKLVFERPSNKRKK
ncbi:Microfibrillar-associated protein 1 [Nymphon striatum]|nr:Microfibrillar-associated protein 1 [Nymphon striatum]